MAEFVRAQIFGTTFEITSRYVIQVLARRGRTDCRSGTQISNLWEWVHSVSYGESAGMREANAAAYKEFQFSQGPVDRASRGGEEDYEAFLYTGLIETNISRIETAQAPST